MTTDYFISIACPGYKYSSDDFAPLSKIISLPRFMKPPCAFTIKIYVDRRKINISLPGA